MQVVPTVTTRSRSGHRTKQNHSGVTIVQRASISAGTETGTIFSAVSDVVSIFAGEELERKRLKMFRYIYNCKKYTFWLQKLCRETRWNVIIPWRTSFKHDIRSRSRTPRAPFGARSTASQSLCRGISPSGRATA